MTAQRAEQKGSAAFKENSVSAFSNGFSLAKNVTDCTVDAAQMTVPRGKSHSVIDNHEIAKVQNISRVDHSTDI